MARKSVTYNPPPHHALRGDQGVLLEQVRSIWLPTRLSHSLGVLVGVLSALVLAVSAEMPQLRWVACPPVAAVLAMLLLRFGVAWENDAIDAFDADTVLDRNNAWLLPVGLYSAVAAAVTSFCCCTIFRGSSFVGAMSVSLVMSPASIGLFVSVAVVFLLPLCLHVTRRSAHLGSLSAAWRASVARKGSWTASVQHFLAMRERARILEEPESGILQGGSGEDRARRLRDIWGRYVVRTGERHDPEAKRELRERVERETSAFLATRAMALKKRRNGTAAEAFVGGSGGAPSTSISDTDACADESDAAAHGFSRKKTTTGVNRRLPQAHFFFCFVSFQSYVYLFCRGVEHAAVAFGFIVTPSHLGGGGVGGGGGGGGARSNAATTRFFLQRDVLQLALLYGLESILALCGGGSTLSGWRVIDFLLHHLPYAIVVGGAALAKVPVFDAYPRTLPLTLLTCPNEAITIAFGQGLSRTFDSPNRLYLLLLMLLLVPVELAETLSALVAPLPTPMPQLWAEGASESMVPMRIVALLTLGAPLYHIFGVIPCCWRKLRNKRSLLANSFDAAVSPPPPPSPTTGASSLDESVKGLAGVEAPSAVTDPSLLLLNLATIASLREGDKLRCWAKSADRHRAVRLAVDRRGPLQGLARIGLRDPHYREHRDKNIDSVARILGAAMKQLVDPDVPESSPKSSVYCKKALRDALQAANEGLGYYKATYANDDSATRKIEMMRNNLAKIQ